MVDIWPNEAQTLDVVVRYNHEPECYGWTNSSYLYSDGRDKDWKLPQGRYLIEVEVMSATFHRCRDIFRLINEIDVGFTIEEIASGEKPRIWDLTTTTHDPENWRFTKNNER